MEKFKIYLKSILIPVIVGVVIGVIISLSIDYNTLQKPPFAPPSIAFPIIWIILYTIMGLSYGILKSKNLTNKQVDLVYYAQLTVNAFWSIFFFLLKWRFFAFIWILILDILVALMIIQFYKKDKLAGLLQIPYLLWVIFASYLNLFVYVLNR